MTTNESFYHLPEGTKLPAFCQGTACFVARHVHPQRWREAAQQTRRLYCLGKCHLAPASLKDSARPLTQVHASQAIVLERIAKRVAPTLAAYQAQGGYQALEKARALAPEAIIRSIEIADLRGRGGAGFPTARKWRAVQTEIAKQKYIIANADEGDPGAYIDRLILEEDPHCLLEAMAIAGHAVGANKGIIYLRREYPAALTTLQTALAEIQKTDMLHPFAIEIHLGQGSYVCGEESALLNAIEGKRPEVRTRPPYPSQHGLFGSPTLVNNVETLANIPWIIRQGGAAYAALGFSKSRGTKVISLNSLFRRPGLYEIEFGMSLRQIVEDLGGGLKHGHLKGLIIGGPLAGIVPPHLLETPFGFEELHAIGAAVGHGGVIAFDEQTSIGSLIEHVFQFGAYESCGKCTPCRLGSRRISEMSWQSEEWSDLIAALRDTSLCGLGTGLAEFAESIQRYYHQELEDLCCKSP